MLVHELIEMLQELKQDAPVVGAYQPQWPITGDLENVVQVDGTVYIGVGGRNSDYLNENVREAGVFEPSGY